MKTYYTTAPVSYDGFSTVDYGIVGKTYKDQPVRKVTMDDCDEYWQTCRYGSGMHLAAPESELPELLKWFMTLDEAV